MRSRCALCLRGTADKKGETSGPDPQELTVASLRYRLPDRDKGSLSVGPVVIAHAAIQNLQMLMRDKKDSDEAI